MNSFASSASFDVVRIVFAAERSNRAAARSAARSSSAPTIWGSVWSSSRAWPSAIRSGQNATSTSQPIASQALARRRRSSRVDRAPQDDERPVRRCGEIWFDRPLEDRHRRPEELVDRRADHDDDLVVRSRIAPSVLSSSRPVEDLPEQLVGARLEERHLARGDPVERRLADVVDAGPQPGVGEGEAQRKPDVARASEDHDVEVGRHARNGTSPLRGDTTRRWSHPDQYGSQSRHQPKARRSRWLADGASSYGQTGLGAIWDSGRAPVIPSARPADRREHSRASRGCRYNAGVPGRPRDRDLKEAARPLAEHRRARSSRERPAIARRGELLSHRADPTQDRAYCRSVGIRPGRLSRRALASRPRGTEPRQLGPPAPIQTRTAAEDEFQAARPSDQPWRSPMITRPRPQSKTDAACSKRATPMSWASQTASRPGPFRPAMARAEHDRSHPASRGNHPPAKPREPGHREGRPGRRLGATAARRAGRPWLAGRRAPATPIDRPTALIRCAGARDRRDRRRERPIRRRVRSSLPGDRHCAIEKIARSGEHSQLRDHGRAGAGVTRTGDLDRPLDDAPLGLWLPPSLWSHRTVNRMPRPRIAAEPSASTRPAWSGVCVRTAARRMPPRSADRSRWVSRTVPSSSWYARSSRCLEAR